MALRSSLVPAASAGLRPEAVKLRQERGDRGAGRGRAISWRLMTDPGTCPGTTSPQKAVSSWLSRADPWGAESDCSISPANNENNALRAWKQLRRVVCARVPAFFAFSALSGIKSVARICANLSPQFPPALLFLARRLTRRPVAWLRQWHSPLITTMEQRWTSGSLTTSVIEIAGEDLSFA